MPYQNTAEIQPTSRNPLLWPFASNSIWNTPIGSDAVYVDARIEPARTLTTDIDHFFALRETDPLQDVYVIGSWRDRTSGTVDEGFDLPIPDELLIPDANEVERPNNSAAFLMPDGETLVQFNALTRDSVGDRIYGIEYPFGNTPDETLDSLGILGGHGGSGLSSIGGTIRLGELTNDEPIRHALKINIWAERYLSYTEGFEGGLGYRWPAIKADRYASSTYAGQIPALQMGSLLAIPPDVTPESLGITTKPALKMFYALQDYGAYTADDPNRDAHVIAVENGVRQEFQHEFGHDFSDQTSEFFDDVMTLFTALHVVDNNGPDSIGGGGTPRAPLAPPLDFSYVTELQQLLDDPTVEDAFRADFNGDGNQDLLWRNLATGLNHVWLQDSEGNQIGGGNILPLTDPNWQIQGTPDVDQDGRADIVWENRMTGAQQTWHLDDLRLWVDPETGRRVTRWRRNASGSPRITFSERPQERTGLTPQANNLLIVNGRPGSGLKVTRLSGASGEVYEIAVVATEADGSINGIDSEDPSYITQVINNAEVVFSTLPDSDISNLNPSRLLEVTEGANLQFIVIQNGTIDSLITNGTGDISFASPNGTEQLPFSFTGSANSQSVEVTLQPPGTELPIVLQIELTDETPAIGTALQGNSEGETIDLRAETGELTVNIDVYREAVSDSLLGFYQVENQQGQVFDEFGNLLSPGDLGYIQAAMRHNISELNVAGENGTVKTNTATIMAGKLLSTFIIVDGTTEQLLDTDITNDPNIYFNHLGANNDGTDHVRLLGDNIFGFEDMTGGGDMDYDDAIVRVSFT